MNWPKPDDEKALKKWHAGVMFVMRGGPYDGLMFRLVPGPYPEGTAGAEGVSGWDSLPVLPFGTYVRPADSNPYLVRPGKPNKARTNVPWMDWVEADSTLNQS